VDILMNLRVPQKMKNFCTLSSGTGSGYGPVAGSCGHFNEPSGSTKDEKFLYCLQWNWFRIWFSGGLLWTF
jgi:hypothetical protein